MPNWLWGQSYSPPAWSPDGSLLAVLDENLNSKAYGELYVVHPDGTGLAG